MATDGGEGGVKINGIRHIVAVAFGCLAMLLCSGVIYGYNALLPLLIQQDAFSSLCSSSSSSSPSSSSSSSLGLLYDCASQKDRLNLLYTLSITCLYTAVLPFGFIVGRIGPRWMLTLSGALFALGAVFMSLGPTCGGPCWSSGLIIFGLVSPGFFMSCLSLGKLFPRSSAHVTTLVIGCFELSTGTFWVLGEIVNSKNLSLSWSETWYIFAGVCGFIAVACAIALPPQEEVHAMDEEYTKERKRATSSHSASDSAYTTDEEQSSLIFSQGQEKSEEEEPGLWTLMKEWKYILPTWMMMVLSLRNAFYVASASTQTSTLLLLNNSPSISSDSSFFNTFFNAALPLGGIVSMPISSWLLSRNKERDDIVLGFVMTMASIQMVFNLVPEFWSQLVATSLFAVVRSLKWSTFSEFMVKRYPLKHFGMLLGFCNLSVALATLAVHPLYLWGTNASLDDETTWRYQHPWLLPNLLLLVLQVIAFSAPIYLFVIISRRRNRSGYGWMTKL